MKTHTCRRSTGWGRDRLEGFELRGFPAHLVPGLVKELRGDTLRVDVLLTMGTNCPKTPPPRSVGAKGDEAGCPTNFGPRGRRHG